MITTQDLVRHDACERLETWGSQFELPAVPMADALHASLRVGLLTGDASKAYAHFMKTAAEPGLDISGAQIYDQAAHHAHMIEVVCAYLLAGPWTACGSVSLPFDYEPLSFMMEDGRLRRVVLCSTWNQLREAEERSSWWSIGDVVATGRPQLVNVIVIGQSRNGFRASPWTTGFIHPENGIMRIKRKEGKFSENWRRVYRENTDHRVSSWLKLMQQDDAFEGIVHHFTIEVPKRKDEILEEMARMDGEIPQESVRMRRSSCFRHSPCPMARLCHESLITPEAAGWRKIR